MNLRVIVNAKNTLLCCALILLVSNVGAQETRRVPSMSESVYKKLAVVQEFISPEEEGVEPNLPKALEELDDINTSKFNKYELANVYNYYGFIHYSLENLQQAIKYYTLVVDQSPDISVGMEQNTYKTIASLYLMTEKYNDAITMYKKYMSLAEIIGAEDYFYLWSAYYQVNDVNNALENVNRAVQMMEDSGRVPKENWYDLQRGLYYEKEDYDQVIQILEKMLVHYNQGKYWLQLAGMYGSVNRTREQLQAYNAAYLLGAVAKERDVLNLAYLNFDAEYPYKAAKVIKKGMENDVVERTSKNLETLGTALRMSREFKESIPIIEEAASKSDDGNLYAQLAGTYFQDDDYEKAIEAAENAIKRKGLRSPGSLHITLGLSQFYLDRYDDALKSFREAAKNKGSEKTARKWIQHTQVTMERSSKMEEDSA